MRYLELTEIKKMLDERGIVYEEFRINGGIFVWTNGLMQIQNPTRADRKKFWPEVRISHHEGFDGYYVKECGITHENQSIEKVMYYVEQYIKG